MTRFLHHKHKYHSWELDQSPLWPSELLVVRPESAYEYGLNVTPNLIKEHEEVSKLYPGVFSLLSGHTIRDHHQGGQLQDLHEAGDPQPDAV